MKNQLSKKLGKLRDRVLNKLGFTYYAEIDVYVKDASELEHETVAKTIRFGNTGEPDELLVTLFVAEDSLDKTIAEVEEIRGMYVSGKSYSVLLIRTAREIDHDPDFF